MTGVIMTVRRVRTRMRSCRDGVVSFFWRGDLPVRCVPGLADVLAREV